MYTRLDFLFLSQPLFIKKYFINIDILYITKNYLCREVSLNNIDLRNDWGQIFVFKSWVERARYKET